MKLKDTVVVTEVAGENMLVEVDDGSGSSFHGIIKLKGSADFIVDCLKEDTTQEAIIEKILAEYEITDRDKVAADVSSLIGKLKDLELIVD